MTGSAGRAQSISDAMQLTIPQLLFFCWEQGLTVKTKSGKEVKEDIDAKCAADPRYKEQYQKSVRDAIQRAKDRLSG